MSSSFSAPGRLCFMIVAFPGDLHIFFVLFFCGEERMDALVSNHEHI